MNQPVNNLATLKNSQDFVNSKDIVFSADSIAFAYGQTQALRNCSFSVSRGEVHALIGENGSGKSTLVKIISGVISPDAGHFSIDNVQYKHIISPWAARELGIGTAFQEILIVPGRSVLENIWLGAEQSLIRSSQESNRRIRAKELLDELIGEEVSLDIPAENLEISRQQLCVIARSLVLKPKIVILDEPTAALGVSDRNRLFAAIRRLAADGTAFMFISHRLDEIMDIADNITVLRAGESVTTVSKKDATRDSLICLMCGDVQAEKATIARNMGDVRLLVKDVQIFRNAPSFNLDAHAGEIIGIAGLEGHGQDQFVQMLAGIKKPLSGKITIETDKGPQPIKSLKEAAKLGLAYVPRNRKTAGIFEPLSIVDNFALPALGRYSRSLFLFRKKMVDDFHKYRNSLSIKMDNDQSKISSLSGGNQQKVLVARWLNMDPNTIIFNDPTRGVDPPTKMELYKTIQTLAASGVTVIFLSTDVDELVALVDRVVVFRNGTIAEEIPQKSLTSQSVVAAFFGHKSSVQES